MDDKMFPGTTQARKPANLEDFVLQNEIRHRSRKKPSVKKISIEKMHYAAEASQPIQLHDIGLPKIQKRQADSLESTLLLKEA